MIDKTELIEWDKIGVVEAFVDSDGDLGLCNDESYSVIVSGGVENLVKLRDFIDARIGALREGQQ